MNILKLMLRLFLKLFFKTKLTYHQQILLNEPSIIIPNHTSFLDAVFVFAYLPNDVCFVINTRIAKKLELPLKLINHVTIDPLSPYSLKKLINLVKSGQSVVIFPEGRISRTGMLMKVYNGIGLIALKTNMRFSRCGAGFGNKKSPHNNLNLTIPSGMALVRVCYVAIRKLKTCSGSFGSRAGTLR